MNIKLDRVFTTLETGDVVTLPTIMEIMAEQNNQKYTPADVTKWLYRGSVYVWLKDGTEYEVSLEITDDFDVKITDIVPTGRKRSKEEEEFEKALQALIDLIS